MVTDPIADLLIQIKNGYMARKKTVVVPFSTMKERVATVLVTEGYIKSYETVHDKKQAKKQALVIALKYVDGTPAITNVKRVSKPGVRIYVDRHHVPYVMTGYGTAIVSTSKGVMSDTMARKQGLGGEVLCTIW